MVVAAALGAGDDGVALEPPIPAPAFLAGTGGAADGVGPAAQVLGVLVSTVGCLAVLAGVRPAAHATSIRIRARDGNGMVSAMCTAPAHAYAASQRPPRRGNPHTPPGTRLPE